MKDCGQTYQAVQGFKRRALSNRTEISHAKQDYSQPHIKVDVYRVSGKKVFYRILVPNTSIKELRRLVKLKIENSECYRVSLVLSRNEDVSEALGDHFTLGELTGDNSGSLSLQCILTEMFDIATKDGRPLVFGNFRQGYIDGLTMKGREIPPGRNCFTFSPNFVVNDGSGLKLLKAKSLPDDELEVNGVVFRNLSKDLGISCYKAEAAVDLSKLDDKESAALANLHTLDDGTVTELRFDPQIDLYWEKCVQRDRVWFNLYDAEGRGLCCGFADNDRDGVFRVTSRVDGNSFLIGTTKDGFPTYDQNE